jgi:hypothetical protein
MWKRSNIATFDIKIFCTKRIPYGIISLDRMYKNKSEWATLIRYAKVESLSVYWPFCLLSVFPRLSSLYRFIDYSQYFVDFAIIVICQKCCLTCWTLDSLFTDWITDYFVYMTVIKWLEHHTQNHKTYHQSFDVSSSLVLSPTTNVCWTHPYNYELFELQKTI